MNLETKNKIPKILYFIWFGNTPPNYVQFCIDNFKRKNPIFDIVFLYKTVNQLENIWFNNIILDKYDETIKKCQYDILNNTGIYKEYIENQKNRLYKKELRFIQLLSDIVRVELINKYGGIYLDCDTFPLKSFDDTILSLDSFCVQRHYLGRIDTDNYFIGSKSRKYTNDIVNPLQFSGKTILQTKNNWYSNIDFWKNKYRFFNLELNDMNILNNTNFYIEHYSTGSWSTKNGNIIKIPLSKFDFL